MGKLGYWGSLLAVVLLHVGIRLCPAAVVFGSDEHRPLLGGADSFYHAHRTGLLFESAPRFVFHDPYMFHPHGAVAQWSLGFDYLIANVLRVLTSEWELAVWWLPFATLLISLAALFSFIALAHTYCGVRTALVLAGCFALNLAFVRVSTPAEYDHHVVETLCVVLLLLLPSRLSAAGSRVQAVVLGISIAWAVWTSTLLAFVVAAFLCLYLVALQSRCVKPPQRLSSFAAALGVPLGAFVLLEASARADYFSFTTLSLLHLAMVLLPLAGLALAHRVAPRMLWAGASALLLLVLFTQPAAVSWVTGFLSGSDAVLGHVNEARPLFMSADGFSMHHAHAFFGFGLLAFPWAAWRLASRPTLECGGGGLIAVVLFSVLLTLLALAQKRLAHLAVPGFVIVLGLGAARSARPATWLALTACLLVEPAVAFFPETALAIPDSARMSMRVANVVRQAAQGEPPLGVSAPPNFGSAINYAASLPSVTNGFFYAKFLQADLAVREQRSSAELVAHLRQNRIGYLVAVDDARYHSMLLEMFGSPAANEAREWEQRPCSGERLRFAYTRIACGAETPPELALLFRTQVSTSPKRLWRKLSVFRVPPRAEQRMPAPPGARD